MYKLISHYIEALYKNIICDAFEIKLPWPSPSISTIFLGFLQALVSPAGVHNSMAANVTQAASSCNPAAVESLPCPLLLQDGLTCFQNIHKRSALGTCVPSAHRKDCHHSFALCLCVQVYFLWLVLLCGPWPCECGAAVPCSRSLECPTYHRELKCVYTMHSVIHPSTAPNSEMCRE